MLAVPQSAQGSQLRTLHFVLLLLLACVVMVLILHACSKRLSCTSC